MDGDIYENYHQEHQRLADALGLPLSRDAQDWGIEYGSAERFEEFLNYYLDHPELSQPQKEELMELVMASADCWLQAQPKGSLREKFKQFVAALKQENPNRYEYWYSLGDGPGAWEFPVSGLMRSVEWEG